MLIHSLIIAVALAAAGATPAQPHHTNPAQHSSTSNHSHHANQSRAPATALTYQSAFRDYRPYADDKRTNWRDVNDTAGVLGGHNAQMHEMATVVTASGTVLEIDRANGRLRIDGDAVKPLGWPAGIATWSLKVPRLAEQVKPGERIAFRLEKDGDVYRIAALEGNAPSAPATEKPVNPDARSSMGSKK